jgi:hypothetical protein
MSHWPEDKKRDWDEAGIVAAFSEWLAGDALTSELDLEAPSHEPIHRSNCRGSALWVTPFR